MQDSSTSSPLRLAHLHFSIACFILPSPLLPAHAFADWLSTWFMRITSCPNSCKRCFVTIPLATPVVKAYSSASAELKLTVCCVRDHAVSVAFLHCTTPPLVLLHVVACPAQSLSVYMFTNFGGVMISIRLFCTRSAFQVSYNTLQIHLVALGWTCKFSCCFLQAVHDVCSLLAHVQQFRHNCSVHRSSSALQLNEWFCRWRPLHTRSHQGFLFLPNQEHFSLFGCTSDSLPPSILVPFARSLCSGSKICHPSSPWSKCEIGRGSAMPCQVSTPVNPNGSSWRALCKWLVWTSNEEIEIFMFKAISWEHNHRSAKNSNYRVRRKLTRTTSRTEVKFPCRTTTRCTNQFPYRKQGQCLRQRLLFLRNGQNCRRYWRGTSPKLLAKQRWYK